MPLTVHGLQNPVCCDDGGRVRWCNVDGQNVACFYVDCHLCRIVMKNDLYVDCHLRRIVL
jgi:hypothetical protein